MLEQLGEKISYFFKRYMPNSFVFALIMTLLVMISSYVLTSSTTFQIVEAWYTGFWSLLEFAMQIVLIIVTGFAIALSPWVRKGVDSLAKRIKTPRQVYFIVASTGAILCLVSFGWIVITCILARELASRVKGVHYPYLIACVYFSGGSWVLGLSSSIPLLLNTDNNFLIEKGVLEETIATSYTLGSGLNLFLMASLLISIGFFWTMLSPKKVKNRELSDLLIDKNSARSISISEEAESIGKLEGNPSDKLNNSKLLQIVVSTLALVYLSFHFYQNGFDLNFNIMIFMFLALGMLSHATPMRFVIAMKRASSNISGIIFQYPFYAGIMGIMIFTGLGNELASMMASLASENTYAFFAFLTGGLMNIVIPSAGGEFAVVGPSIISAVQEIAPLSAEIKNEMVIRASMAVAYGESLSNSLQPFYLLLVFPVMAKGIQIQARDVMGYLMIPFFVYFVFEALLLTFWPL